MQVFAQKGFRGTTTRDLANEAGVNEAIIFRYFKTKEELYSAIIEHKAGEHRNAQIEELERLATAGNDEKFFEAIGRTFLRRHEEDTSFLRLLLFSALEGHQLSDMFVSSMAVRHPIGDYVQQRIDSGAFGPVNAQLAARGFFGMLASYVLWQEVFGFKEKHPHDRDEVVRTFVSIFLRGMKKDGNSEPVSS